MKTKKNSKVHLLVVINVVLLILLFNNATAQILNAGFENWTSGEPNNWLTDNQDPYYAVTQTTDSHGGSYAIKGTVVGVQTPYGFSGLTPGVDAGSDGKGFPFTGRPSTLRGFLKFLPKGGDIFTLTVGLLKNNNPIGTGEYVYSETDTSYHEFAVPIVYQDSITVPDRIEISFFIQGGGTSGAAGVHEGSTYYIDDISAISLVRPITNEIIISGEKYTIKWVTGGAEKINLDYSLDEGNSWQNIVSNYPADSSKYVWDVVPKDLLSRKARMRIEDSNNKDNNDKRAVKFKPWQLTRIDANGDFELFEPDQDGWNFPNGNPPMWPKSWWQQFDYQNGNDPKTGLKYPQSLWTFKAAKATWFPDWPTYVDVFGMAQCYYPKTSAYKIRALTNWVADKDTTWAGSCEGFAVSSILYFYHKSELLNIFPGIGNYENLYSASLTQDSREAIFQYFTHQYGKPFSSDYYSKNSILGSFKYDIRQTLQELKNMFRLENGDAKPLIINSNIPKQRDDWHTVVAYKLERKGDTHTFNLGIYDNNYPGHTDRIITIDSVADTWSYSGFGIGQNPCYLGLASGLHLNTPLLFKRTSSPSQILTQISPIELYNSSDADINIISNSGETTGYVDSTLFNNITGAIPIIPKTGYPHPPIGYYLSKGAYSVHLSNSADSSLHAFFMTDSTIYNYRRFDADSNETDNVTYSNGIKIQNPDVSSKNVNIQTVIDHGTSENDFETNNILISQDDSINIKEINRKDLLLNNYGTGKNYDLHLRSASANGEKLFFHSHIQLASNSAHQIVPDWGNLETGRIKILIDNGNDGTIDDSISISNEITGIEDGSSSNIPAAFTLYQNYPNPFNPTTTISYDLAKASHVRLTVYNVLGKRVAELVDSRQNAGSYNITFNASQLASGVYFYRLQSGKRVLVKKMMLMK